MLSHLADIRIGSHYATVFSLCRCSMSLGYFLGEFRSTPPLPMGTLADADLEGGRAPRPPTPNFKAQIVLADSDAQCRQNLARPFPLRNPGSAPVLATSRLSIWPETCKCPLTALLVPLTRLMSGKVLVTCTLSPCTVLQIYIKVGKNLVSTTLQCHD